MGYLRNCWYVAAWSRDIGQSPIGREILEESVVLYRTSGGAVVALEDRCAHRHVPLSRGKVNGDLIECGYHGLRYDCAGMCVHVPAQDAISPRARIKRYRVEERHGWVWVWMGDFHRATPDTIPDFHRLADPSYAATGGTNQIAANYELVNDNLMDLSHVGYVHGTTIGNDEFGPKATIKAERTDKGVRVTRWVIDCAPPPTYCKAGVFIPSDRIDRWAIIDFEPPGYINIHVGGVMTGSGGPEGKRVGGLSMWVMNAMTPVSSTATNYFWAVGRDFQTSNEALTKLLHAEVSTAFNQDKEILEIQQSSILKFKASANMDIVADAGSLQARRLLGRLIQMEEGALKDELAASR